MLILILIVAGGLFGGAAAAVVNYFTDVILERHAVRHLMGKPLTAIDEARIRETVASHYQNMGQYIGLGIPQDAKTHERMHY